MKNFEVKYTKGHLVNVETGKRIFLKRGGKFLICGDNDQFEEKGELFIDDNPLNSDEKKKQLQVKLSGHIIKKIADSETNLIYRVGLSKRTSEDISPEFLFNTILLEDLYIASRDGKEWSLCPCKCITTECLEGDMQMIEPVRGESLSNLFANVITFYFPFQRSTACNAFNTFYFISEPSDVNMWMVKNKVLKSIGDLRKDVSDNFN